MNNDVEIGKTVIEYGEDGKVKTAKFEPVITVTADDNLLAQFKAVDSNGDLETLKNNAELVFAAWFSQLSNIELADREQYGIVSEIVNCEYYEPGRIKSCCIKMIFRKF